MIFIPGMCPPHETASPSVGRIADLDLNLLVTLEALLLEHNVTRAAQRLGLTQSAMSHRLRKLRELFDDPLLVGGRSGMLPTPLAQSLLGPLREGLTTLRAVFSGAQAFDPATSRREFTVVSTDYAEFAILPLVLEHASRHAPAVSVTMLEPWPGMYQALEDGSVDLVVSGGPVDAPAGIVRRVVAKDSFRALVRQDHPAVGKALDLQTYVSLRHLVTNVGIKNETRSPIDRMLEQRGLRRHVAMRIPHFVGGPFIVAKSDLVLTTSAALAHHFEQILPVRALPLPFDLPPLPIQQLWHERYTQDPGHRWLRELSARCTAEVSNTETGTLATARATA